MLIIIRIEMECKLVCRIVCCKLVGGIGYIEFFLWNGVVFWNGDNVFLISWVELMVLNKIE